MSRSILKKSAIGWRFTDKNYTIINNEALKNITINSIEESKKYWKAITHSDKPHLILLEKNFWNNLDIIKTIHLDWGEENSKNNSELLNLDLIAPDDDILFFWGRNNSVMTNWETFLKNWDDFCYPSDDNNLLTCPKKDIIATYVEDKLTIYKKY